MNKSIIGGVVLLSILCAILANVAVGASYKYPLGVYFKDPELNDWNSKAESLAKQGNFSEANEYYDKIIEKGGKSEFIWWQKGNVLDKMGRLEESLNAYEKAIEIREQYVKAWTCKGDILCKLGRFNESIEAYQMTIQLDPNYAAAWNSMGISLQKLGKTKDADAAFAKAKKLGYKPETVVS
jgi:tetratricopeptide (TPR) repeat protein